jgi:PhnB protein
MHGSVTIGEQVLMGADVTPDRYEEAKGISLSLHLTGADEAERVFHELAKEGRVVLPLEKTFWAERFGMVIDRFGIPWMINCEAANPSA